MSHHPISTLQSDARAPEAFAGLEEKKFAYCIVVVDFLISVK